MAAADSPPVSQPPNSHSCDQGTDRSVSGIVVNLEAAVIAISGELLPPAHGIADGGSEFTLAGDPSKGCHEPDLEVVKLRAGTALADRAAKVRRQAARASASMS
jgi:hypothetical protein